MSRALRELPEAAPLGSFHVLAALDGTICVGRFTEDGWTIFMPGEPMPAAEARRQVSLVRHIIEGRRVISGI
jgi:hypothetical protein